MEKAKVRILIELIGYAPHAIVIKSILEVPLGSVSIASFDKGESLTEEVIPFDNLVQIVDGSAEIVIDENQIRFKRVTQLSSRLINQTF